MIGDISLMDNCVDFISRHHGRRGPKEPIFRVVVPFAVLINASFTYSELNITIPEDSLDIVADAPAKNPIRTIVSARLSSQVTQSQCLGSSCGSRQRAAFSKSDEESITKERLKRWPAIYKDDIQRCMGSTCGSQQRLPVRREVASDEELGLKGRLKRQPSRAGRKGPRNSGKKNYDLVK
jgi:hypothetical protein